MYLCGKHRVAIVSESATVKVKPEKHCVCVCVCVCVCACVCVFVHMLGFTNPQSGRERIEA